MKSIMHCGLSIEGALKSPKDWVNNIIDHPAHYTAGGIECIDAIAAATVGLGGIEAFCTANAIKYLWRWKRKNGVEDLQKAKWYINRLIIEMEQSDNATVESESISDVIKQRDAAILALKACSLGFWCATCKYCNVFEGDAPCKDCIEIKAENKEMCWEWRGFHEQAAEPSGDV
jgi:hypothetical protein